MQSTTNDFCSDERMDTSVVPVRRSPEERLQLKRKIPELLWTERLIRKHNKVMEARLETGILHENLILPIYSLTLGNQHDQGVPSLLITGAVHGVERIGTKIILAWLTSLLERLDWDEDLRLQLEKVQIVIIPIVNPVGVYSNSRCNGNGVDLNRNAPIDAEGEVPMLGGGHRISRFLPWYRGRKSGGWEEETKTLEKIVQRQIFTRSAALVLDVHSGFGMRDRLWIPYAFRKKLIGNIHQYVALKKLWERCFPSHDYIFEPQALHYVSHGDLWDYFSLQSSSFDCQCFLPLTLELGSWNWVKKRPQQIFNFAGLFNPQKPQRLSRVLRRHIVLLDFLLSAATNHKNWLPTEQQAKALKQAAKSMWRM